jgi:hypothetical protein
MEGSRPDPIQHVYCRQQEKGGATAQFLCVEMEVETPSLCIQRMHIAFSIRLFMKALREEYKDHTKAIVLATDLYTHKTDKGGGHEQGHVSCYTNMHHLKLKASTSCPSTS